MGRWVNAVGLAVGASMLAAAPAGAAIDIVFNYSYDTNNFFADSARRTALEAAASTFESAFGDSLGAITSDSENSFDLRFSHPATGAEQVIEDYSVPANQIIVFAGGRDLTGNTLGVGGPGGFFASGFSPFFESIKRGQSGYRTTGTLNDTDFGPWGGSITFDTPAAWNFSVASGPSAGQNDFYSVALHELGHLLGVSSAESWDAKIASGQFTGPDSVAVYGGNVPLSDDGHWADGTMSQLPGSGIPQEAAMDPSIFVGSRKLLTTLDWAGLSDIGWEVDPSLMQVPEPTIALPAIAGLALLARRRRV